MNRRFVSISITLGTLALIAGFAIWESTAHTSPGPLHPSHEQVPELSGRRSCNACHRDGDTSMANACTACHEPIAIQINARTGLHGALDPDLAGECDQCHREHVAGAIALISDQAFEQSGVPAVDDYDHAHVGGLGLEGRHNTLQCEQCHANAHAPMLADGETRYIGLTRDCTACHDDPHDGTLPDCSSCHGQEHPFDQAVGFSHDSFALVGGHDLADCSACHIDLNFIDAPTDCLSCHSDDYDSTVDPAHRAAGIVSDCDQCHSVYEWGDAAYEHTPAFLLTGSHAGSTCNDCHKDGYTFSQTIITPQNARWVRTCEACHDSPHTDGFSSRIANLLGLDHLGDICQTCHADTDTGFASSDGARMPEHMHAATGFVLEAPHADSACAECHGVYEHEHVAWPTRYPGRQPDECQACHEDPHQDQFAESTTRGRCVACHDPHRFTPSNFDAEMHAACRFPITGAHRAVGCVSCHPSPDGVTRFVPTPTECSACHDDVHAGRFNGPDHPKVIAGNTGCARCHSTDSFHDLDWSADEHDRWAGYPLTGAHAEATCRDCHTPANNAGFARAPTACASCHTDPHVRQFDVNGTTDCQRCHTDTTSFAKTTFDHNRDARYVLDEHHELLECAACHRAYPTPGGDVIRYRPLGTECTDCHGSFIPPEGGPP